MTMTGGDGMEVGEPMNAVVLRAWEAKAAWWDEMMGDEGNAFHRTAVLPPVERLLALQPGERVLDVACGSGPLARRLAAAGATVTATDGSAIFLACAQARAAALPPQVAARITYAQADATDEAQLLALGPGSFDAVVCTMALMDMPEIAPLCRAAARLLKPGGRFVFAVPHPSFNSSHVAFVLEERDRDGVLVQETAVKVLQYLQPSVTRGVGAPGEPGPHYYFHRPLSLLLAALFQAGMVVDGLEETAFGGPPRPERPLSWANLRDIPAVLAVRARVGSPGGAEGARR